MHNFLVRRACAWFRRERAIDASPTIAKTLRTRYLDGLLFGGTYLGAAVAAAIALPAGHPFSVAAPLALIVFVLSSRFGLLQEVGWVGCQQAAFVFLVFTLPLNLVPLAAFICVVVVDRPTRAEPIRNILALAGSSWYALITAVLLALLAPGRANWHDAVAYVAVFGGQFLIGDLIWALRCRVTAQPMIAAEFLTVLAVDAALTPIGLAAAVNLHDAPAGAIATIVGVTALLSFMDREHGMRRRATERALRDPLTGLANRALFDEAIAACDSRCRRSGQPAVLMLVDLDEFKPINDSLGHQAGDEVLRLVADALRRGTRTADTPVRLGGDEFAVILAEPIGLDGAERVAAGLREQLAQPAILATGEVVEIRFSVGYALIDGQSSTAEVIARADAALYADKRARKQRGNGRSLIEA